MKTFSEHINKFRVREGMMASNDDYGLTGAFRIPMTSGKAAFVVSSNGMGWEHVSVSLPNRCPNWEEMSRIKDLFWNEDEAVMQLHPPKSEHINNHIYCLHLWRPLREAIPLPPSLLVGVKDSGIIKV